MIQSLAHVHRLRCNYRSDVGLLHISFYVYCGASWEVGRGMNDCQWPRLGACIHARALWRGVALCRRVQPCVATLRRECYCGPHQEHVTTQCGRLRVLLNLADCSHHVALSNNREIGSTPILTFPIAARRPREP